MTASTKPPELQPGLLVADRFDPREVIGRGGMGLVYRAVQQPLGRDVALKVILPEKSGANLVRERFIREAKVAATLQHPNAVKIYDFGEWNDKLYLAMELLPQETLRATVDFDRPGWSVEATVACAKQLASVLEAAAKLGLVHRDLKPENILVDRSSTPPRYVVVDFGLAFIQDMKQDERGRLTREGVVTGTPDYMSPEQARATSVTPQADIYSLGCVLYEMLTSNPPFDGDSTTLLSRHLFVAPVPVQEIAFETHIPHSLNQLIMRMLSKRPEQRPTPTEIRHCLDEIDHAEIERGSNVAVERSLGGRQARMVSTPAPIPFDDSILEKTLLVHVLQAPSEEDALVFAANGIMLRHRERAQPEEKPDAALIALKRWRSEASLQQELLAEDMTLMITVEDVSPELLTELMHQGVHAVVASTTDTDTMAELLWRAVRKRERRRKSQPNPQIEN